MQKLFLAIIFTPFVIFAQEGSIPYLKLNTPHRLIGHKVRVRAAADNKAKVQAELSIGTEIVPLEQSVTTMAVDGVEAPWYRVRYARDGGHSEGYIWGNLIAKAYAESKDGKVFLFGTGRRQKDLSEGTEFTSQARVALDGEELARLEVKEGVGFQSQQEAQLSDGRGLEGVEAIFRIGFLQQYCGGKGNTMFFFWNGKKLLHAHSSVDGADAPYYAVEVQIFPADTNGRKGHIILEREHGDHDDPKTVKNEKILLKWNGKKLKKVL